MHLRGVACRGLLRACDLLFLVETPAGIEPTTYSLRGRFGLLPHQRLLRSGHASLASQYL